MVVKYDVFDKLIRQLRSVEIDGELFFVVEGDLLMTLEELREVSEKQLRFYVACQRAIESSQQARDLENQADDLENDNGGEQLL